MTSTSTRAFGSPFRYIQGPGEIQRVEHYTKQYGNQVFALIDGVLFDSIRQELAEIFNGTDSKVTVEAFSGECCRDEIDRVTKVASQAEVDVMVGIGGGKALDTSKVVSSTLGIPLIILPTSASTDAPTSSLAVLYTNDGEHAGAVTLKQGAQIVLVDTDIILTAPSRLFVSGMGDALATYFEAKANAASDAANYIGDGYRRCRTAMAVASECYEVLLADGASAKLAVEQGVCTPAVENVIEANILMSGLGFENTGCAGAHAVPVGLSALPVAHGALHGEEVAFGLLFQLVLENAPQAEIERILRFYKAVGLPMTLRQMNVEPTADNFNIVAAKVADPISGIDAEPFKITEELVYAALVAADAMGSAYLARD
jgi:glycerol dehydrogenase